MAFFFAILRVPRARQVVTTAGRPSGMAATARATAILKYCQPALVGQPRLDYEMGQLSPPHVLKGNTIAASDNRTTSSNMSLNEWWGTVVSYRLQSGS
ncbi:MAG: hypothetical protein FRX49_12391 [Trebouxia sp. A1-2]|nr:MAG: hypothetical protein FRX49_12391 [Trebouxia sp. A1-2]